MSTAFATRLYVSDISASDDFYKRWHDLMPKSRQERCDRFKFEADRHRCIMAYALLVYAIRDTGISCDDTLPVEEGEDGKPSLAGIPVYFNISHAGERVAVAISTQDVGCDVECRSENALSVAKRFFAPEEYAYLESIDDEDEQKTEFTRIWTMKESVIKCCGEGIRRRLDDFSCTNVHGARKSVITLTGINERYHVKEFASEDGYCYSVCGINEMTEDAVRRVYLDRSGEKNGRQ